MLVLGLTSGLSSLGYSVINTTPTHFQQIECDLLSGSRTSSLPIYRRCNAHRLVLSVVLERWRPAVLALGPPVDRNEPDEWIIGMRAMMGSIADLIRVPVVYFPKEDDIIRELSFGAARSGAKRRLNGLVAHHLGVRQSGNRRIVLATATALAAAFSEHKKRPASSSAPPPP